MTDATDEVLLTMQDAVELIRRETGIPITRSQNQKILSRDHAKASGNIRPPVSLAPG